jgi:hypothetical protein
VTGDGLADVLVGVPGEDIGNTRDAGSVVLLRGSKKGLTGTKSQTIDPVVGRCAGARRSATTTSVPRSPSST